MELEQLFNPSLIRRMRFFRIEEKRDDLQVWVTYDLGTEEIDVMYRIHERGWRKVIDLAIGDEFHLRNVYVENLTYQDRIRQFWTLVVDNHANIRAMVHHYFKYNETITLRYLQQG